MTKSVKEDRRIIRFKSSCGLTCTWRLGKDQDGRYKVMGLSKAMVGRRPIPLDFVPFKLSNAVINGRSFGTLDEAESFVRSL